jgi:hypothetical protein
VDCIALHGRGRENVTFKNNKSQITIKNKNKNKPKIKSNINMCNTSLDEL